MKIKLKTTDNNKVVKNTSILYVLLFLIFIFSSLSGKLSAQGEALSYGVGAECLSTGNGLGGFSSPYLSLSKNYNQISIGALVQSRNSELQGFRLGYVRNLSGAVPKKERVYPSAPSWDLIEISGLAYFQYCQNSLISKAEAIASERINRRNEPSNFSSLRLNSAEAGIGIELRINVCDRLVWRNYVGAGYYYHLTYKKGLEMDRQGTSLLAGTGLQFNL